MTSRVCVTLKALSGDFDPSERVIDLDIDSSSIRIGRASKTLSKGLQGARDNTWFDSPVMSRDHAELFYDTDTTTLHLTDIGSLHGTLLNGSQLSPHEETELNDGDILTFGAEVRRGMDTFPPCSFQVNFEVSTCRATNTYAFPESSDLDEDEEFDFSDNESENEQTTDDGVSASSPHPKISQSINAIDLTGDASPPLISIPSIDLTSNAATALKPGNISVSDTTCENPTSMSDLKVANTKLGYGYIDLEETESEDEPSLYSSGDESGDSHRSVQDAQVPGPEVTYYNDESDFEEFDEPEPYNLEDPSSEIDERHPIPETQLPVTANINFPELHPLDPRQEILVEMVDQSVTVQKGPRYETTSDQDPASPVIAPFTTSNFLFSSEGGANADNSLSPTGETLSIQDRQPSPSDAIMAKILEGRLPQDSFNTRLFTSGTLGEGTGKEAYFEAREKNKTFALEARKNSEGPESNPTMTPREFYKISNLLEFDRRTIEPQIPANIPVTEVHADGDNVPSRVKMSTTRDSTTDSLFSHPAQPSRSSLSIEDIIDRPSPERAVISLKRKADEISITVEDEVRAWASTSKSTETNLPLIAAPASLPVLQSQLSDERAKKRLRTLMERVGYAALGGVAVGAALFGGLVATAPDFL